MKRGWAKVVKYQFKNLSTTLIASSMCNQSWWNIIYKKNKSISAFIRQVINKDSMIPKTEPTQTTNKGRCTSVDMTW